jgi:hypothetical protein
LATPGRCTTTGTTPSPVRSSMDELCLPRSILKRCVLASCCLDSRLSWWPAAAAVASADVRLKERSLQSLVDAVASARGSEINRQPSRVLLSSWHQDRASRLSSMCAFGSFYVAKQLLRPGNLAKERRQILVIDWFPDGLKHGFEAWVSL